MKAAQYAEALYTASLGKDESEAERLVENLTQILSDRNHLRLLPSIVRELANLSQKRASSASVVVTLPSPASEARYAHGIEKDVARLEASALPRSLRFDETIIGGYEIRARGKRIDRTHKRTLIDMYHTITRE